MYINLYFQFDEPNYEGYQPNWHELIEYKKWKHPNEEFCRKDEKKQKGPVKIVLAYPIILVCTLCKQSKKYVRLNHSTFMIHFREEHQEKLKEARVAKCPISLMWFNNVLSAKHHGRYNHTDIITSCKQLNDVYKIIEKRADKSQAKDYKKQEYTTQL